MRLGEDAGLLLFLCVCNAGVNVYGDNMKGVGRPTFVFMLAGGRILVISIRLGRRGRGTLIDFLVVIVTMLFLLCVNDSLIRSAGTF